MSINNIESYLTNLSSKEKTEFKRTYKYINNVNTVDWNTTEISSSQFKRILKLTKKKLNGEDISLDIGFKYFRDNKIHLKKGVFIPQYDTESIIDLLPEANKEQTLLEVGSGSGVIAICANKEKGYKVTSIDVNKKATKLSILNAKENNATVNFVRQDLFTYQPKDKFDVLISNPPYIDINDENVEDWVKQNQPSNALYAEECGYSFYQKLILNHELYIKDNGLMIFEIGFDQGESILKLTKQIKTKSVKIHKDLDGKFDRFIVIKF